MEIYWYIIVIIFIIIKIFFYICWYRSRQRQLAAYLSNPRNAQIVIVGGRAYLHQMCESQNTSIWPSWYGVQDDSSVGEPSASLPPAPSYTHLDVPPPYEAVLGSDDLKPPPYTPAPARHHRRTQQPGTCMWKRAPQWQARITRPLSFALVTAWQIRATCVRPGSCSIQTMSKTRPLDFCH
uniref:Si:dkey-118j18.2 n=1 Tax=Paramormyrops kingsleyae TaxID=1676925 RepID=A0A3B3RPK4_9TELE